MKNIWKFWKLLMIAFMALAMIGCPQNTSDDEEEEEDLGPDNRVVITYPEAAEKSDSGIYEVTIPKDGVSVKDWGGDNVRATIKVVFVTVNVAQKILDGTIATEKDLFVDANNCLVYCNNKIGNGMVTMQANSAAKSWVRPAAAVQAKNGEALYEDGGVYEGVLVSKADQTGDYKAIIDVSKIRTSQLMWKGSAEVAIDETNDATIRGFADDIVNRIPLVVGGVSYQQGRAKGIKAPLGFWSAAALFGVPSEVTWPEDADIKFEEPKALNFSNLTHVAGTLNGWTHAKMTKGVYEIKGKDFGKNAKGTEGDSVKNSDGPEFKLSDGTWSFSKGNFNIAALNQKYIVEGTSTANGNGWVSATIDANKTYEIHYEASNDGTKGYVWIIEKGYTGTVAAAVETTPDPDPTPSTTPVISTIDDIDDAIEATNFTITATLTAPTETAGCVYAWYESVSATRPETDGTAIADATTAALTAQKAEAGTYYFYLKVTNTETGKTAASAYSNVVTVTVTAANP